MWWKIYFWILAVVAALNVIGFISQGSGLFPLLSSIVCALAVYAYSYKKSIFPQRAWKLWLVIVVLAQGLRWHALASGQDILSVVVILSFGLIVFVPAWYCIYRHGFGKKEQVKIASVKSSKNKLAKKNKSLVGTK